MVRSFASDRSNALRFCRIADIKAFHILSNVINTDPKRAISWAELALTIFIRLGPPVQNGMRITADFIAMAKAEDVGGKSLRFPSSRTVVPITLPVKIRASSVRDAPRIAQLHQAEH